MSPPQSLPADRLDEALSYLRQQETEQRRLPPSSETARHARVSRGWLTTRAVYQAAFRQAAKRLGRSHKGVAPYSATDEKARAEFDRILALEHRAAPHTEIAALIGVKSSIVCDCPRYRAHRRAKLKELGLKRGGKHSKENDAIAWVKSFLAAHARLPSPEEIADQFEVQRQTVYNKWKKLRLWRKKNWRRQDALYRRCKPHSKEHQAILCLRRLLGETKVLPWKKEIAACVGIRPTQLYMSNDWPTFDKEYKAAERLYRRPSRHRPTLEARRNDREARAVEYQDEIFRSGRLATVEEVARHVGVVYQTLFSYPKFIAARRGIEAKLTRKNRGRWPTRKEDEAIAWLEDYVATVGWVPALKGLRGVIGYVPHTVGKWKRFRAAYRKAIRKHVEPTRWGTPRNWREGRAIAALIKTWKKTGRVLGPGELAEILDVGEGVFFGEFRMYPILRAAHRSLMERSNRRARPECAVTLRQAAGPQAEARGRGGRKLSPLVAKAERLFREGATIDAVAELLGISVCYARLIKFRAKRKGQGV